MVIGKDIKFPCIYPKPDTKGFAYYRVSTSIQKSIPTQRMVCQEYAERWKLIIVEEFEEVGSASKERPIFTSMLKRLDEIDFIICWDEDRLFRTTDDLFLILSLLDKTNTVFINSMMCPIKNRVTIERYIDLKDTLRRLLPI